MLNFHINKSQNINDRAAYNFYSTWYFLPIEKLNLFTLTRFSFWRRHIHGCLHIAMKFGTYIYRCHLEKHILSIVCVSD